MATAALFQFLIGTVLHEAMQTTLKCLGISVKFQFLIGTVLPDAHYYLNPEDREIQEAFQFLIGTVLLVCFSLGYFSVPAFATTKFQFLIGTVLHKKNRERN